MTESAPALKEIFNLQRIQHIADETSKLAPAFDKARFLALCQQGLAGLSLMTRLRRVTEALHATLPGDYRANLTILKALAPRLNSGFVTMALPEYVALYGIDDFDVSMDALRYFTAFGSSEFAVRYFLQHDLARSLAIMEAWAEDENEHVRRLASEGCRPRLPWSFQIIPLKQDPAPIANILEKLKADPALYVRRSVANNLNDITKDNPDWVLDRAEQWPRQQPETAWILKHALRSLVKKGDARALALMGAGEKAQVTLSQLRVTPSDIQLGQAIEITFALASTSEQPQRLIIDYAIHYVKKSGAVAAKVFKLKTLELDGLQQQSVRKKQQIANFTTRVHYAGQHKVDIIINGEVLASSGFNLVID